MPIPLFLMKFLLQLFRKLRYPLPPTEHTLGRMSLGEPYCREPLPVQENLSLTDASFRFDV